MTIYFKAEKSYVKCVKDGRFERNEFYPNFDEVRDNVVSYAHDEHGSHVIIQRNEWGEIAIEVLPWFFVVEAILP